METLVLCEAHWSLLLPSLGFSVCLVWFICLVLVVSLLVCGSLVSLVFVFSLLCVGFFNCMDDVCVLLIKMFVYYLAI